MIWWLRAHATAAWAATLAACFICCPLLATSSIPTLSLFSGASGSIPVPLVLPVFPACVLLYGLNRTPWQAHATAVREMRYWTSGAVAITGVAALAVAFAEAALLDFPLSFAVARNLIGYLGVGLLVQYVSNAQYGAVAVAAIPVVCGLIGTGPGGRPYPWMWPAQPYESVTAAGAAIFLFCSGMLFTASTVKSKRTHV
ncbi:hypothetical protein [Streptomyces sp. NPDC093109]|uniref:hypothetical protein n=1 Tax=Streptomyces sp. NPDC093109 TaxID=3154977 RepID=UPI00344FAB19